MSEWVSLAAQFGVPTLLLVIFVVATWRALVWLGTKILTPLATKHIELIDETCKTIRGLEIIVSKLGDRMEVQQGHLEAILLASRSMHEKFVQFEVERDKQEKVVVANQGKIISALQDIVDSESLTQRKSGSATIDHGHK